MPSIKDLKKSIGTVKNTQQTTRAMKMVSAAKLRRAQEAIQNQRPYANRISALIRELIGGVEGLEAHPLMRQAKVDEVSPRPKKILLVAVTSDRGLCAGFNSNVIKATQRWLQSNPTLASTAELSFVGRKGYDFFKTRNVNLGTFYQELGGKVSFAKAKKLADSLVDRFLKEEVDEVKLVYNQFKNAVTQNVVIEDFLPLSLSSAGPAEGQGSPGSSASLATRDYIVKPSPAEVLHELVTKNFAIQAFKVLLETQAGEHGARMSAMENATKNAGEMIKKLTLQYNKQRQAGITKELLEIIAGSESQKG